jgi:hypothetical protein
VDADMQLVLDTLYELRQGEQRSCFVTNAAGLVLLQSGSGVVPSVEKVLREVVDPALRGDAKAIRKFPGLDYVIGALLVLGANFDTLRLIDFLASISGPLLAEVIKNVPVFLSPMPGGYKSGISLSGPLLDYVQSQLESDRDDVRGAAKRCLEMTAEAGG